MKADDLFGDADDLSDEDDDEPEDAGNKTPRRSQVLSDDEDDVRRGSDLERDERSRSRSPKPKEVSISRLIQFTILAIDYKVYH